MPAKKEGLPRGKAMTLSSLFNIKMATVWDNIEMTTTQLVAYPALPDGIYKLAQPQVSSAQPMFKKKAGLRKGVSGKKNLQTLPLEVPLIEHFGESMGAAYSQSYFDGCNLTTSKLGLGPPPPPEVEDALNKMMTQMQRQMGGTISAKIFSVNIPAPFSS
jgi:hypothetical protein